MTESSRRSSNHQGPVSKKVSSSTFFRVVFIGLICVIIGLQVTTHRVYDQQKHASNQLQQQQPTAGTGTANKGNGQQNRFHNNNNNNTSAACLLVMDDNHRLVEWLAYHHFTTNLRYVIVAVDPRSSTSPQPILERYSNANNNNTNNVASSSSSSSSFQYEIWGDDDYMGNRMLDKRQKLGALGRKHLTTIHRVRQKAFYQYCLERFDDIGLSTWTLLIDVDEYLVVNEETFVAEASSPSSSSLSVSSLSSTTSHLDVVSSPGGIYNYLQDMSKQALHNPDASQYEQFLSPCITMPRLLFGTKESSSNQMQHLSEAVALLPDNIYTQLDTTRWLYHAKSTEFDRNGNGKTIVDLGRIPIPKPHFQNPVNPHRPFQDLCKDPKRILDLNHHPLLRVHHYISTWETYSFRNDSRKGAERSREAWEFRAFRSDKGGATMDIVPWLDGFVRYHGKQEASRLLEGVGLPAAYTHSPQANSQWNFIFLKDFLDKQSSSINGQYNSNYGAFLRNRTGSTNASP